MEKPEFEAKVRLKLEGHVSSPSVDGWSRLESRLDADDRTVLRRSRNRYRAIAASLALVVVSYAGWLVVKPSVVKTSYEQVIQANPPQSRTKPSSTERVSTAQPIERQAQSVTTVRKISDGGNDRSGKSGNGSQNQPPVASAGDSLAYSSDRSNTTLSNPDSSTPVPWPGSSSKVPATVKNPIQLTEVPMPTLRLPEDIAMSSEVELAIKKVQEPSKHKSINVSWMALGYSSGNFQQSILAGSPDAGASRFSAVYFGKNVGRLSIFSGVALSEQEYNSTSNLAYGNTSVRKALSTDMVGTLKSTVDLSATNTYEVNTQKRYLSVPVQIGWYLVDRKVKGMISAGLISDYFLNSMVSDVSGLYKSSVIRRGGGSNYAGWVFSGLAGMEWSWSVSGRYQIALCPGIRYALTPVYRKETVANGKSVSADVGLRVRYFF